MPNIIGVLARVFVEDIDAALELDPVISGVERTGGQILEGPSPAPNGRRLIAHHPDGSVFEYIESA
jgi:predicted enzyme related to lactoylglutathione lyase